MNFIQLPNNLQILGGEENMPVNLDFVVTINKNSFIILGNSADGDKRKYSIVFHLSTNNKTTWNFETEDTRDEIFKKLSYEFKTI